MGGIEMTQGDASALNLTYDKSGHDEASLKTAQEELSRQIGKNGVVLLENREGSGYPYAAGIEFSIFSHSSIELGILDYLQNSAEISEIVVVVNCNNAGGSETPAGADDREGAGGDQGGEAGGESGDRQS